MDFLFDYKKEFINKKLKVLYPATDTNQDSNGRGFQIVMDHAYEILNSKEMHIYWNPTSTGSEIYFGSGIIEHKRRGLDILLMNPALVQNIVDEQIKKGITKSYEMVLLKFNEMANKENLPNLEFFRKKHSKLIL